MIEEFTLQNRTSLRKVTFGQDNGCDFLFHPEEVNWGTSPADHSTYTYPGQIGVSISNTSIKERNIQITGFAYYIPTEKDKQTYKTINELNDYVYDVIKQKKNILNDLINPMDDIRISIKDYYIDGKPAQSIAYGNVIEENNEFFCRFLIDLYCYESLFKKDAETMINKATTVGKFHFPLILSNVYPTIMGIRTGYNTIEVNNEGGLTTGGKIILIAKDEVINPKIINSRTGEEIKINKTMHNGEKIIINTSDGNEKGIKGYFENEETNYFRYWDFENSWIKFNPGKTDLIYTTENESELMLDVSIEINFLKFALEDM